MGRVSRCVGVCGPLLISFVACGSVESNESPAESETPDGPASLSQPSTSAPPAGQGSAEGDTPSTPEDTDQLADAPGTSNATPNPEPASPLGGEPGTQDPVAGDQEASSDSNTQATEPAVPSGSSDDSSVSSEACLILSGSRGCDYLYVAMTQSEPPLCVQLNLDSCDVYGSPGLRADLPFQWRLATASVIASPEECTPGQYRLGSSAALSASGSIEWTGEAPGEVSDLAVDVVLQVAGGNGVPDQVEVRLDRFPSPLPRCDPS